MPLIVNLYGGPGTGKSTTAAGVFSMLKLHDVNCELVTEFAKDLTWEGRSVALGNQVYILGKQYHKIFRLLEDVDVIITDSPLLLGIVYDKSGSAAFKEFIMELHHAHSSMNIFLKREKKYNPKGRGQNEDEAKTGCDCQRHS